MILIYFSLVLIIAGLSLWVFGAVLYKRSNGLKKKIRKKNQERALLLGTIAKITLIVAALVLVLGVMMLSGVKLTPQQ